MTRPNVQRYVLYLNPINLCESSKTYLRLQQGYSGCRRGYSAWRVVINPQPVHPDHRTEHGQDGTAQTTPHKANVRLIAHDCNKKTVLPHYASTTGHLYMQPFRRVSVTRPTPDGRGFNLPDPIQTNYRRFHIPINSGK